MTLPISSRFIDRFTPSRYPADDPRRPTYLIAAPTLEARNRYEEECTARRATPVGNEEVREGLLAAMTDVFSEEAERATAVAALSRNFTLIDLLREEERESGKPSVEDDPRVVEQRELAKKASILERRAMRNSDAYARLISENQRARNIRTELAVRSFLLGMEREGGTVDLPRRPDGGVDGSTIPPADQEAIGDRAVDLGYLTEADAKN